MYKDLICFIPARSGSSRLKNKNLRKIKNETLVDITIKQALKARIFKKKNIVLSSNSNKILKIGCKYGIKCVKRSEKNSRTFSKVEESIKEFINHNMNIQYNGIVLLQVTSPLRKVSTLKKFTNHCLKKKLEHCLTVSKIYGNISKYSNKFFNSMNQTREMTQLMKPFLYENSLIYFVSKTFFSRNKKVYPKDKWNYFETNKYESIDINDIEDLIVCKKLI